MGRRMSKLTIVTGYYEGGLHAADTSRVNTTPQDFFKIWHKNTSIIPHTKIYVVNAGVTPLGHGCEWINAENLGHARTMNQRQLLGGWSASLITGCLLAYHNQSDLLFKEQDCLAFGPYLERLYEEIGTMGMITGRRNQTGAARGLTAQSLILIRRDFLLDFMHHYLSIKSPDAILNPEHKFDAIEQRTGAVAHTAMGFDRDRPINFDALPFYAQQWSDAELAELVRRGMV
jgi:hypothetical protein